MRERNSCLKEGVMLKHNDFDRPIGLELRSARKQFTPNANPASSQKGSMGDLSYCHLLSQKREG
jgi:hypothetical protein